MAVSPCATEPMEGWDVEGDLSSKGISLFTTLMAMAGWDELASCQYTTNIDMNMDINITFEKFNIMLLVTAATENNQAST